MSKARFVHFDGEIVPWEQAQVHVSTAAFRFGTGVFEGIRGYWNVAREQLYLFRLDDHARRLVQSQRFMRFESVFPADYVAEQILSLVRANEFREDIHIMASVFVNGSGPPTTSAPVALAITALPGVGRGFVEKGCSAQVSSWQRLPDQAMPMRIKCNANYQNSRLASLQAHSDGYDTAVLMNARGKLSEGPGMCLFVIRDGVAVTPSVTSDILESITRRTVLELLPSACDVAVVEREMDRSELVTASEAFFCGTVWEITPCTSIDRLPVGDGRVGPVVRRLQQAYFAVARGELAQHPEWRSAVYP